MLEPYVAARLRADDLARSPIRKIMELADRQNIIAMGLDPDDVISFAGGWVNHEAPEPMRATYHAIIADAELFHQTGGYSPTIGLPSLRENLLRFDAEIYGTEGFTLDNIIVGQSSTQLTYCLFTTLLDDGDTVLLLDPAYANYGPQLGVLSDAVNVVSVPVLDPGTWKYFEDRPETLRRIDAAMREHKPKLLLFSSPDNPTGRLFPDQAFDTLLENAAAHGCTVAVDFAYRAQYFVPEQPAHFAASPARHPNFIAIHSNSKWCRGLGRRLGWIIAEPSLIDALAMVQQSVILCPDSVHQEALSRYLDAALNDGSLLEYLESARRDYAHAGAHLAGCIEDYLQMPYLEPEGGLYSVVDVGTPAEDFVHAVLAATGVIFVPGGGFGKTLANGVRISFGPLVNDLDRMEEGFPAGAGVSRRSLGKRVA